MDVGIHGEVVSTLNFVQGGLLYEDGLLFKIDKLFTSIDRDTFIIFTYLRPSDSSRNDLLNDKDSFDLLVDKVQELRLDNEIIIILTTVFRVQVGSFLCDMQTGLVIKKILELRAETRTERSLDARTKPRQTYPRQDQTQTGPNQNVDHHRPPGDLTQQQV